MRKLLIYSVIILVSMALIFILTKKILEFKNKYYSQSKPKTK